MIKTFHAFIIEDHPLITESYSFAFERIFEQKDKKLKISICKDVDCVLKLLMDQKFVSSVDLIILDIQIPLSKNNGLLSGEDLGLKIRKLNPSIKIMVSTSLNDNFRIYSILKSLNPEGFLIKNDIDKKELILAIQKTINNPPCYSTTVLQLLRRTVSTDLVLDANDRKLLFELSIGTKLGDLQKILPLSVGGIEKKRRNLKIIFNIGEGEGDRALVLMAKEKGFI